MEGNPQDTESVHRESNEFSFSEVLRHFSRAKGEVGGDEQ